MSKKSCIIYDSWGELITNLPNEMAGELIKLILGYAFDGEMLPSENPAIGAMFAMIKAKLDEDADAYEEVKNMRSEAARKRWAGCRHMQEDASACTSMQMNTVSVSVSDSVSDSVTDKDKKKKTFVRPSVDEVREYCRERGNGIDPEAFVDFYESKGWKIGNNPMKDWKAAVRTWEKREQKPAASKSASSDIPQVVYDKIHNYPERSVNYAALGAELLGKSP